jgi:Domain of unknown function (DUF4386)
MNITNESPFGTNNRNAVIAGVLFIIGTVSGMISAGIGIPVWNAPDYLLKLSANASLVNLGTMLQFTMGISCAGISIALYPIVKKYSTSLAIGAVGFRLVENMLQILKAVSMITLLALSQQMTRAGSLDASYLQSMGQIITTASDWMIHGAALICFSIGAAMYYIVFYQYRLVPRWLSAWGLIGVTLVTIASALVMLGVIPGFGTVQMIANLPILPQELVFAVWLIVKGVSPSVSARSQSADSLSAQPVVS